jgi:signal transduction histidine kinase
MWKHVLPPVVIVIAIWLAVSSATSVFISYSDRAHQRILEKNVASVVAASELQATCWRIFASVIENTENSRVLDLADVSHFDRLDTTMLTLRGAAVTPVEKSILKKIEADLAAFRSAIKAQKQGHPSDNPILEGDPLGELSGNLVVKIDADASTLRHHNQEAIESEQTRQKHLLSQMMLVRNLSIIFGPIVGVVLGWRVTTRLQRHVSTLAITLRNAPSSRAIQVGEVSLRRADGLHEVQLLSEGVVNQMKTMLVELERAEQEVIQAERLSAVGELAAGVAHELRNPLTSVKLLLQHAVSKQTQNLVHVDKIGLILREVARMEETIQGLLDFSRPAKLSSCVHDIRIPLQRAVTLVSGRAESQNVEISYIHPESPLFVNGDVEQIHLVFVNLLINAIEAIQSGGKVEVTANRSPQSNSISVAIRDTGCGIPPAIMSKLFEPFATSKERGTGLGLALCHRIVKNHQGSIRAQNLPSGGAEFELLFPAIADAKQHTQIA